MKWMPGLEPETHRLRPQFANTYLIIKSGAHDFDNFSLLDVTISN